MSGSDHRLVRIAALAAAGLLLSAVTGLAFAAWIEQAPDLVRVLSQAGLGFCL